MNKQDKELLTKYYKEVWKEDNKMVDYCVNKVDEYIVLDNGCLVAFEKPNIKKDFCFGYSLSSYDNSSYDNANEMVSYARKSEEYFIEENLRQLESFDETEEYSAYQNYKNSNIVTITDEEYIRRNECWFSNKVLYPLNKDEKKRVKEAKERQINKFKKRLTTYLKKYGLTKVNTWSYWRDA